MICQLKNHRIHQYSFTVDTSLRLRSLDKNLRDMIERRSSKIVGVPYYELLPRIAYDSVDLIAEVIKTDKARTLNDYPLNCFYGSIGAHIIIKSVKNVSEKVSGASVTARLFPRCELFRELEQCRNLIEIGKAAASLAHGVRNPLNTIKGSVFYLKKKYAQEREIFEFAKLAEDEIVKLDEFLTKFLSTSGSDSVFTESDLNGMLKRIEAFTALQAAASNVDYVTRYGDIPLVLVNYFEIEQAIFNVITNAIEAMPQGGTLTIGTLSARYAGNEFVVVEIADTGLGLSRRKKGAFQSGPVGSEGRGYGLYLSSAVFRRHGGNLTIKSKKGSGTKVRLSVPAIGRGVGE